MRTVLTIVVGVLILSEAAFMTFVVQSSNCGGNSAALVACGDVLTCLRLTSADRGDQPVSIGQLTSTERERFNQVAGLSWITPSATVLVSPAQVGGDQPRRREIIAVCDTPFDNVPRRRFGKAPLTHAVAYADGSTGLISVREFRQLDLSKFVDIRIIQNSKQASGRAAAD